MEDTWLGLKGSIRLFVLNGGKTCASNAELELQRLISGDEGSSVEASP